MFIRFVSKRTHPNIDAELGMFAARDYVDFLGKKGVFKEPMTKLFTGSVQMAVAD